MLAVTRATVEPAWPSPRGGPFRTGRGLTPWRTDATSTEPGASGWLPYRDQEAAYEDALRRPVGVPYRIGPRPSTPHVTYTEGGKRRTVWCQDARGTVAHLPVLRKCGVRHTVLWAIGFEDPALWRTPAAAQTASGHCSYQRWSDSNCAASDTRSGSLPAGPSSCAPTGRPSPTLPAGTLTPGQPRTFHGQA